MTMRELTDAEQMAALEPLRQRKAAYQIMFGNDFGRLKTNLVEQDLVRFCRAETSCFDPDPRKHAVLEGRREVWLRIQQHLTMTPEALALLYGAALSVTEGREEDA